MSCRRRRTCRPVPQTCVQEEAAAAEMAAEAAGICGQLEGGLEQWELRRLLGGPYDDRGAVVTIQARVPLPAAWHLLLGALHCRWLGMPRTAAGWRDPP